MTDRTTLVELAEELAEIAMTTTDAATGVRIMKVVERLLAEAGLPSDDDSGGEIPPTGRLSEPVWEPV
jgi:hypothetical protein